MTNSKVRLYNQKKACEVLGISNPVFYKMVAEGIFKKIVPPGKKHGLYLADEIDSYAEAQRQFREKYSIESE